MNPFIGRLTAVLLLTSGISASFAADTEPESRAASRSLDLDIDIDSVNASTAPKNFGYVLGASVTSAPQYDGSELRKISLRPVIALRYGRFRLSTSSASSVLNFGSVQESSGASAELIRTKKLKLKASLRLSSGRTQSDSSDLSGIPNIRKTVIGRIGSSYSLTDRWAIGATVGFDLLGRGTGLFVDTGAGYTWPYSATTVYKADFSLGFGNATNINAYFGVPLSAQTATRPAFDAGAGLRTGAVSLGFMTALDKNWVLFGRASFSTVLGEARQSPLVTQAAGAAATFGIGYRCCR